MRLALVVIVLLPALAVGAQRADAALLARLSAMAPGADVEMLRLALSASRCAASLGLAEPAKRLAVIDYGRPSTEPRMWVFDISKPRLLYVEHVAHGRGSGEDRALAFSNREGSHQTSLGLFSTAETYIGANGYSLRMDGLEPGINDLARERAIVMHGAPYVDPEQARRQGRLGRSFGCPAVRSEIAVALIDSLKRGQLVYAWYPDPAWRKTSRLLRCDSLAGEAPSTLGGGLSRP